jgi:hypothetical protein
MNKEEVINKINEMTVETFFSKTLFVQQKKVIELIEQLDEPEKVKIPQFVAEIIEYYKGQNATLYDALREKNFNKQYSDWLLNEQNAYNKVARAWLDGYEVEKEKRYLVKVVGMNRINGCLSYNKKLDKWFFGAVTDQKPYRTKHTRKELEEAGFGWVFSCKGVEIEEVKDEI